MDLKDYLKKNIPEFQQGNPSLDSYLDAAGDFLNGIKEAIEHFDYSHDYEQGEEYNIEYSLRGQGLDIPRALPLEIKRFIVRDLQEILIKNGTEDSLKHSLRLIGFNAEIRRGWLPSPRNMRKGFIKDPVTGEMRRYDVNKYVYTEMLYGTEKVTEDGVFFDGYRYNDTFQEDVIENLPILGETYKTFPANDVAVSKTPYIIVRFEEGDFNVTVEDYVDPETGETYTYSSDEEFRLVNEVIQYFISGQQRPSTIRVIIIVSLQPFEDEFSVEEDYVDTHTYNPDGGDEYDENIGAFQSVTQVDGSVYTVTDVGSAGVPIGISAFYSSPLTFTPTPSIGSLNGEYNEIKDFTSVTSSGTVVSIQDALTIGLRLDSSVTITSQTEEQLSVFKSYSIDEFQEYDVLVGSLQLNNSITITSDTNDLVHAVRVRRTPTEQTIIGDGNGNIITDSNGNAITYFTYRDRVDVSLDLIYNPIDVQW